MFWVIGLHGLHRRARWLASLRRNRTPRPHDDRGRHSDEARNVSADTDHYDYGRKVGDGTLGLMVLEGSPSGKTPPMWRYRANKRSTNLS